MSTIVDKVASDLNGMAAHTLEMSLFPTLCCSGGRNAHWAFVDALAG